MKKIITILVIACALLSGNFMYSQAQTACCNKKREMVTLKEDSYVKISYFTEHVATQQMYCLNFQNNGKTKITFTWTLKGKNGEIIGGPQTVTVEPGKSINGMDNPEFNKAMCIGMSDNQLPSDFTIEIQY